MKIEFENGSSITILPEKDVKRSKRAKEQIKKQNIGLESLDECIGCCTTCKHTIFCRCIENIQTNL